MLFIFVWVFLILFSFLAIVLIDGGNYSVGDYFLIFIISAILSFLVLLFFAYLWYLLDVLTKRLDKKRSFLAFLAFVLGLSFLKGSDDKN